MTSATVSRLIKEELLNSAYPEIYRPVKRVAPKSIRKIKKAPKEEIKIEIPLKRKKRSNKSIDRLRLDIDSDSDNDVDIVATSAPRRPYQWKGRRVRKILRPGTVISFTPGQMSSQTVKRSYDEVYADNDILEQAEAGVGEFAYGKRPRIQETILLDNKNSTPSLTPITPQIPVQVSARKRPIDLQPTVQMMVPSKIRKISDVDMISPMAVEFPDTGPSSLFNSKNEPTKMEIDDITIRPLKQVTSDIGVQTVDVSVPTTSSVSRRAQGVRYHPSIIMGPKYVRRRRRRRRQNRRRRRATSSIGILPQITYHPTINPL